MIRPPLRARVRYRVLRVVHRLASWAATLGAKHCLATANGTSALIISLNALGIGPGDEVIVPPYTFVATVNAVLMQHAIPVFVDTDPETFQIDARKIEAAITERTRCILPVHVGGSPADLDAILEIEQQMGRRRTQEKGPRIIDIDIVLFGNLIVDDSGLTIPHPAMHERRFVLEPLAEIAPDILHPLFKRTIQQLREALPAGQAVRKMSKG